MFCCRRPSLNDKRSFDSVKTRHHRQQVMDMELELLPPGWRREEITRPSGLSTGKADIVYISPRGERFKSKIQLQRYFRDKLDLTAFDFETGKINPLLLRKHHRRYRDGMERKGTEFGKSLRNEALFPPIRQTASIFKQPVTIVKRESNKIQPKERKNLPKTSGLLEKPRQTFWEKRLQGLRASNIHGEEDFDYLRLPRTIRPIVGPAIISEEVAIRSLADGLHVHSGSLIGQTAPKADLEKNSGVHVNPTQPLVTIHTLGDEDIERQATRVKQARLLLAKEMEELSSLTQPF